MPAVRPRSISVFSASYARQGPGTQPTPETPPASVAVSMTKFPALRWTPSAATGLEGEAEMHPERRRLELGRQRRERARLSHRPQGGLVVERVARALLEYRRVDLAIAPDLEQDDGAFSSAGGRRGRGPPLADLGLDLAQVVREGKVRDVEASTRVHRMRGRRIGRHRVGARVSVGHRNGRREGSRERLWGRHPGDLGGAQRARWLRWSWWRGFGRERWPGDVCPR